MFAESLLESSPKGRKRKRWPMATAFTAEMIIAALVVIVPLLSTGVIPLSARVQPPAPLAMVHVERAKPIHDNHAPRSGASAAPRQTEVVLLSNNSPKIPYGGPRITTSDPDEVRPGNVGPGNSLPEVIGHTGNRSDVKLVHKPFPVSVLSEAQLLNRVEPVYPKPAIMAGVQGEVKLHAIIARDGKIMSLSVISGHPLLVRAAEDAVSQWRYRPYYLNGEAVEVETFITVRFTRGQL